MNLWAKTQTMIAWIGNARVADRRPVDHMPAELLQKRHPVGREIHINQDLNTHATTHGTSRSSTRHAAYARA